MSINLKYIQDLIASGKTMLAFDKLVDFCHNNIPSKVEEVVALKARLSTIQKSSRMGIVSMNDEKIEVAQINYALLNLLREIFLPINAVPININHEGDNKTTILFITANAQDIDSQKLAHLRLDLEFREISNEIRNSKLRDQFNIIRIDAATINDLQDSLLNLNDQSTIFHFAGHGTKHGILLLDVDDESGKVVPNVALQKLFVQFSNEISCVFLSSCYSDRQGILIKESIDSVIGMSTAVPDDTAVTFSKNFYKALGAGRKIGFAFQFAKNSINLNELIGEQIPILLQREEK